MSAMHRIRHRLAGSIEGLGDTVQYARHLLKGHRFTGALTRVDPSSAPVVLVHGFLGTRGTMEPLSRRLQQDGRAVFSYAHGNLNLASIESSAKELLQHIRGICRDLGVSRVDIVGYSMGGLLGLYAIKFLGGDRHIRTLTMLGSPLRGSWLGLAGVATLGVVSASAWQLLPGSSLLAELRTKPLAASVRVCQIHARSDAFCPNPGRMSGVADEDYVLVEGGHSTLVVAEHVYTHIRRIVGIPEHDKSATTGSISGSWPIVAAAYV